MAIRASLRRLFLQHLWTLSRVEDEAVVPLFARDLFATFLLVASHTIEAARALGAVDVVRSGDWRGLGVRGSDILLSQLAFRLGEREPPIDAEPEAWRAAMNLLGACLASFERRQIGRPHAASAERHTVSSQLIAVTHAYEPAIAEDLVASCRRLAADLSGRGELRGVSYDALGFAVGEDDLGELIGRLAHVEPPLELPASYLPGWSVDILVHDRDFPVPFEPLDPWVGVVTFLAVFAHCLASDEPS